MSTLDQRMNQFRISGRELFNNYFRFGGASGSTDVQFQNEAWLSEERFSEVEALLFEKLVLEPSSLTGRYGERNAKVRVSLASDFAPIMINRAEDSGYWDHPLREITRGVRMEFIRFFDWDQISYRDNRYVRVYLAEWPEQPAVVGKHALVESQYVVYAEG